MQCSVVRCGSSQNRVNYHLHVDEIEADIAADSEENLKRLANVD